MKTYKLKNLDKKVLKEIASELKDGKIAVFPTDTVYGLGTNAFRYKSVKKIYAMKNRDYRNPMPVLFDSILNIKKIIRKFPAGAEKLAKKFWPGGLTLIFETNELGAMLTGGRKLIAARIPDNKILLSIIKEMGCPLIGTSANVSGKKNCKCISGLDKKILKNADIVIDGGTARAGIVSTVLDVSNFPYVLLREGSVPKATLGKFMKL